MWQPNFFGDDHTACLLRPSLVSMSTTMEIAFDHSFFGLLLLLGSQGGATLSEASPDSIDRWNWYTKLGPFFSASSFDCNFRPNNNQTFIVYVKSTLVLYRNGLCAVWGFTLEEKLRGAKCCKFYGPEGVLIRYFPNEFKTLT